MPERAAPSSGGDAQLVPNLLADFEPQGTLALAFSGQTIDIGQNMTQDSVSSFPTITVTPSDNATNINTESMYTVIMVDANPVGTDEDTTPQTRHWLVNTVSLDGNAAPYGINYTGSTAVTDYAGPGPASGSGSHRYVVLLYAQSSAFSPPSNLSTAGTALGTMYLEEYVNSTGLGPLVAANYFQVENGVATVSVPATSAVVTSTLAAPTTSGSTSASGTAASGSGTSSAATSATSKAAAAKQVGSSGMGLGVVVGAVGVVGCLFGAGLAF